MLKRLIIFILIILLAWCQYKLWSSKDGVVKTIALKHDIAAQQERNRVLVEQNAGIQADIAALKKNPQALEEHARADLGMIKNGEVLYQVVEKAPEKNKQM